MILIDPRGILSLLEPLGYSVPNGIVDPDGIGGQYGLKAESRDQQLYFGAIEQLGLSIRESTGFWGLGSGGPGDRWNLYGRMIHWTKVDGRGDFSKSSLVGRVHRDSRCNPISKI